MAYGFEIKTADGKEFLGINEETYMYWGKALIFENASPIHPFNIPISVDIEVYYYCNEENVYMEKGVHLGNHSLTLYREDGGVNTAIAYAYIFMKPTDIAVEGYGLALYKEDSTLQWHSARPPLSFSHLVSGLSTTKDSSITTGTLSAVRLMALGFEGVPLGGNQTELWSRRLAASSVGGVHTVSVVGEFRSTEDVASLPSYNPIGPLLYLGCIDTAYFDSISNKGNWA